MKISLCEHHYREIEWQFETFDDDIFGRNHVLITHERCIKCGRGRIRYRYYLSQEFKDKYKEWRSCFNERILD